MKTLSIAISVVILAVIYARVDPAQLGRALADLDLGWLALAALCFVPQMALSALRWRWIAGDVRAVGGRESWEHVLASHTLNVILPSKMGDLAKGYFLTRDTGVPLARGLLLATAEKLLDLGSLCLLLLTACAWFRPRLDLLTLPALVLAAGVLIFVVAALALPIPAPLAAALPARVGRLVADWGAVRASWWSRPVWLTAVLALTVVLWVAHLVQIHLFFLAAGSRPDALKVYALTPVALLAGLVPVTLAGFGTRDAALLYLFAGDGTPAVLASVGLLTGSRYVIPALAGLPFLPRALRARAAIEQAAAEPGINTPPTGPGSASAGRSRP